MLIGPGGAVSNLITTKVKFKTALLSLTTKLGALSNLTTTKIIWPDGRLRGLWLRQAPHFMNLLTPFLAVYIN